MKVEEAVLGSLSLIVLMVSVDVVSAHSPFLLHFSLCVLKIDV